MKQEISLFLELTKFRVSFFATLSAVTGFILARQGLSGEMVPPVLGIFVLASGACALNQYQERRVDLVMRRTEGRPIPSGKLSPRAALAISLGLLFMGFLVLFLEGNVIVLGLGLFAVSWYIGVYTPLKRRTIFAVIPGALVGAVPPVMGWSSGGGDLRNPQIVAVAFFFFIWQVPHFWFLLLKFGKDYEGAGFPVITRRVSPIQFSRMILVWIFAAAVAGLMIPLFGRVESWVIPGGLLAAGGWLVWTVARHLVSRYPEFFYRSNLNSINLYVLLVMALLSLDPLFH